MSLPPYLSRVAGVLRFEDVPLDTVAERFGTPTFVYSRAALTEAFNQYQHALAGRQALVCYAVKANSNLAILDCLARLGAGFDIVSGGELTRVLAAGGRADRVIFSGVGKSQADLRAALTAQIRCFNVESISELERLSETATAMRLIAPVSLRVNPDVDANTHPYISTGLKESKFGIAHADALAAYQYAARLPHLRVVGIDCHIGSQLLSSAPLLAALDRLTDLIDQLEAAGIEILHLDLGGGVGVRYADEQPLAIADFVCQVLARVDAWRAARFQGRGIELLFEPGRSVTANAGVLLTRIEYLKPGAKNFAIVDAAMNDLIRPTLYDAWHAIEPVCAPAVGATRAIWDLVGPVCESGDWLARDRDLTLVAGEVLALLSAGAYAMSMASNYNSRPRAAEVLIDGESMLLVREREALTQLFALERRLGN